MRWMPLVMLMACSGGGSDAKDGPGSDTDTGTDTDTNTTGNTDTATGPVAQFEGTVVDASGTPVDGLPLKLCIGSLCRQGETKGGGGFDFVDIEADWHSFEVVPPVGSPLATTLVPLVFDENEERSLTVTVLELGPSSAMPSTPTEVTVAEGLYVTLSGDDLEPPLFVEPATEVAGVRVPDGQRVPVDEPGTIIDMWYVAPFDHHATNGGLPVRFDNLWGLGEGETYEVWVGSYEDSAWLNAGTVTVSGSELVGDALLPVMSTIVLVDPT